MAKAIAGRAWAVVIFTVLADVMHYGHILTIETESSLSPFGH